MNTETEHETSIPSQWSRRGLVGLASGGLALLLRGAAAAPGNDGKGKRKKRRRRKPRFRTITRTFTNASPIAIQLGTANPYPSPIQVSGFRQGKLLDVDVSLKALSHGVPEDIRVLLQSPNGRRAFIMGGAGGQFAVSNLTLMLDDQAAASLPETSQLGTGRFKPTNYTGIANPFPPPAPAGDIHSVKLATFTGVNPNGIWQLFIHGDDVPPVGTGSFGAGWSLTIRARVRV
jgi:hypothetical protein